MTRKLARLIPALVATLALAGASTSVAQAEPEFTASNTNKENQPHETASVRGEQVAEPNVDEFVFGEGTMTVTCNVVESKGTLSEGLSNELTLEPIYEECLSLGVFVTHITPNGCRFVVALNGELLADLYNTVDALSCPTGKEMDLTLTNLLQTKSICTLQVGAQAKELAGLAESMTKSSPTDVTLFEESTQLEYKATNLGGAGCSGIKDGEHLDGKYVGETTLTAKNSSKEALDISLTGE